MNQSVRVVAPPAVRSSGVSNVRAASEVLRIGVVVFQRQGLVAPVHVRRLGERGVS